MYRIDKIKKCSNCGAVNRYEYVETAEGDRFIRCTVCFYQKLVSTNKATSSKNMSTSWIYKWNECEEF